MNLPEIQKLKQQLVTVSFPVFPVHLHPLREEGQYLLLKTAVLTENMTKMRRILW